MADIKTVNGIMVTMVYVYNGQRIVNVYHATRGVPATFANLQAIAIIFRDWETSHNRNHKHTTASLVLVSTKALDGPGSPVWDLVVSPAIAGTRTNIAMPSYCTVAVKHTTGLGGRSYRGRTYLCALSAVDIIPPDTWHPAQVAAVNTSFAYLRTTLAAAGFTFCIVSKYSGVDGSGKAIPRMFGLITPIVASECGVGLDTQRHRKIAGIV